MNKSTLKVVSGATIWKLPTSSRTSSNSSPKAADDAQNLVTIPKLETLCRLDDSNTPGETVGYFDSYCFTIYMKLQNMYFIFMLNTCRILWEPTGSQRKIISLRNNSVTLWDLDASSEAKVINV